MKIENALRNDFWNAEIPSASKQFLTAMSPKEVENINTPDWEEMVVNYSFVAKAVYYASKNGKNAVSSTDVIEWLDKLNYKIDVAVVLKMLDILYATGVITRFNENTDITNWEWQLKD